MIMNDRELLEMAAKAAGLYVCCDPEYLGLKEFGEDLLVKEEKYGNYRKWNPLDDDGDAFRLAVSLSMQVVIRKGWVEVLIHGVQLSSLESCYSIDGCMRETARRAIVLAATRMDRLDQ